MNKRERLEAFFNNQEVDHVPVGLWRHFPPEESHGQAYVDAQMKFYRDTDQDFVKISCDGYFGFPNPVLKNLEKPEDLFAIKPLGKDHPFIAEQVQRGADIVKALDGECMCFYTMFCPLSYLRLEIGWDRMMDCMRENPEAVKFACDVIAEDVKALVKGLLEAGCDGVFYSVQSGNQPLYGGGIQKLDNPRGQEGSGLRKLAGEPQHSSLLRLGGREKPS